MRTLIRAGCVLVLASVVLNFAMAKDKTPAPAPAPSPAPATAAELAPTAPLVIYDLALQSGWQNWSWAKTELSVEIPGSARKPIKVEAGPWQALYLHHDAFSTSGYQRLTLLIQGSAPDGQVRVQALVDGKAVGDGHLVKLSNTGWTRIGTPLADLGVEDTRIDGIWVQNATPSDLPKFYVTEIKLE